MHNKGADLDEDYGDYISRSSTSFETLIKQFAFLYE